MFLLNIVAFGICTKGLVKFTLANLSDHKARRRQIKVNETETIYIFY